MGKLTDAQKSIVDAILADTTASKQQQADKLTEAYRTFGSPYDRVVFSVNGARFRAALSKRTGDPGVDPARDIYSPGGIRHLSTPEE